MRHGAPRIGRLAPALLLACALAGCWRQDTSQLAAPVTDHAAHPVASEAVGNSTGQPGAPADASGDQPVDVREAQTLTAIAATRHECAAAVSARMRRVCGSDQLRRLHWANREHFALLRERFPDDARTVQMAAERQLEACPDAACLRKAYADWESYLGENYDLFDAY